MTPWRIERSIDLTQWQRGTERLGALMYTGSSKGHRLEIRLLDGGKAAQIDGDVRAYFIHDASGKPESMVPVTGMIKDNLITVEFPAEAYQAGRNTVLVRMEKSGVSVPIYAGSYSVQDSEAAFIIDPEDIMPSLSEILAQIAAVKTATENAVKATNTVMQNEQAREEAEDNRKNAESARESSETARNQAEKERVEAERRREKADNDRAETIRAIQATLDELTYKPIAVTSFKSNHAVNELGIALNQIVLSWTINKAPTKLEANFASDLDLTATSYTWQNSLSSNKVFTLTASDEKNTVSASTTVSFVNGIYYGAALESEITNTFILSLNKSLQSTKAKTITATADEGQYVYYALPTRYGTPSFNVGGFDGGFSKVQTINFTNASGYSENYDVWRSDNASLGSVTVKIS